MGFGPHDLGHFRIVLHKLRWEVRQLSDAEYSYKVKTALFASQGEKTSVPVKLKKYSRICGMRRKSTRTHSRKMVSLLQSGKHFMSMIYLFNNYSALLEVLPSKTSGRTDIHLPHF
jgi:hypothetical protein